MQTCESMISRQPKSCLLFFLPFPANTICNTSSQEYSPKNIYQIPCSHQTIPRPYLHHIQTITITSQSCSRTFTFTLNYIIYLYIIYILHAIFGIYQLFLHPFPHGLTSVLLLIAPFPFIFSYEKMFYSRFWRFFRPLCLHKSNNFRNFVAKFAI